MSRNLNRSKASYKKRCFYYKSKKLINKVVPEEEIAGLFYAKYQSINKNSYLQGSTRSQFKTIMLETPDAVSGLEVDDFVVVDGKTYRVISIDDIPLPYGRFNYGITLQGDV